MPLRDGHEQLRDELLPIVHECDQVTVTIRAQDMTEDQLTRACILLKETEDHFHTLMQTDPGNPLRGEELEILAFSDPTDINEYWTAVYGGRGSGDFFAVYLFRSFAWDTAVVLLGGTDWGSWVHEYAHHLDWTFNQAIHCLYPRGVEGYLNLGPTEGLAEYVSERDYGVWISLIGDGSNLPALLDAWKYWERDDRFIFQYGWGYLIVRFLFEEHPQAILALYDTIRAFDCSDHYVVRDFESYASEILAPLEGDFHRWARSFANLTRVRQIESVTLFIDDDGNQLEVDYPDVYGHIVWRRYFHTSLQDLAVSATFSIPYRRFGVAEEPRYRTDIVDVTLMTDGAWRLLANRLGTVEVTVTLTAPDGESAQQTFTVNVARDLHWQLNPVVVRDPVSTEEGYAVVDLSPYFTGPALEESEFSAVSHNPNIALAEVRDGRLFITGVSTGEVAITVRGNYHGRVGEQTFTVSVTEDCPTWLCERGAFTGWRSILLRGEAESSGGR